MKRSSFLQGVLLLLLLWQLFSFLLGSRVLPGPLTVVLRFAELFPQVLWQHILASLARVVLALLVSAASALPLGLLMGRSRRLDHFFSPLAYLLYPVPKIALLPVVILVFGTGDLARILLVALVLFFQMLLAVRDGARNIERQYLLSIRSLGAGKLQVLRYVILPAILPRLLTALRIGTGTALAVLFFAETFFTRFGLGYFIVESWMRIRYPDMFAGILGIGILGFLLFRVIDLLERRFCSWTQEGS